MPVEEVQTATEIRIVVEGTQIIRIPGAGIPGPSAYQIWLDQGNSGTEQDFLDDIGGGGGGGPVLSDQVDDTGQTHKFTTTGDITKLAGIQTGATVNYTDAYLLARANHTGTQSADTLVNGTTNKVYTNAEQTKLTGIQTGATQNDTDANLKARANHTGTQTASTISDFATASDARIAIAAGVSIASLVGGVIPANQLPSYVDDVIYAANLAAFPAVGEDGKIYLAIDTYYQYRWVTGVGYVDITRGKVTSVNGFNGIVVLTQDDVGDGTTYKRFSATEKTKLTGIATGATANQTDAYLLDRTNHTGVQTIATVTGLQTALDAKIASPGTTVDNTMVRYDGTAGAVQTSTLVVGDDGATQVTAQSLTAFVVKGTNGLSALVVATTSTSGTGTLTIANAASNNASITASGSLNINVSGTSNMTFNTGNVSNGNIVLQTANGSKITQAPSAFTINPNANGATGARFLYANATDTGIAAGSEAISVHMNMGANTRSHVTGAVTLQRDMIITGSTHVMTTTGATMTDVVALAIVTGAAGNLTTITNYHGLFIGSTAVNTGTGSVGTSYGATINAQTGAAANYAAQFLGGAVRLGDTTTPAATPSASGFLYSSGGALYWKGSSGSNTLVAAA